MRKFELFKSEGDGISILVEVVNNKAEVIMTGDYYHNKIDHLIEGYLMGVKEYTEVECEQYWIDIDDESEFDRDTAKSNQ